MFHQGYALKVYLKKHSSVNEMAEILGVTRQAINNFYGQEELSKENIRKLEKAGVKIEGITVKQTSQNIAIATSHGAPQADTPLESAQDKYIKSLEETVALQKEMIQILKEKLGIK